MSDAAGPPAPEPPAEPAAALPDDPVLLQQMVREVPAALRQPRRENEQLQHRLDLLLRRLYGPRTERFDPNQPLLIPDAFEPVTPETGAVAPPQPEPNRAPANDVAPARPQGLAQESPARASDLRADRSRAP